MMNIATQKTYFTSELFGFLRELAVNNDREWFRANRDRYEAHVREPAVRLIMDFGPRLERISGHFRADPRRVGGSLFRIHRDTRFSRDPSPYKTHAGIHFRHEQSRDAHAPGFYLHLEPGNVFVGAGIWHPDGAALRKIRQSIHERQDAWQAVLSDARFGGRFRLTGDALKRAPKGYDPGHPLIEDLKRKDFAGVVELTERAAAQADFLDEFTTACRDASPLIGFLCGALSVPF